MEWIIAVLGFIKWVTLAFGLILDIGPVLSLNCWNDIDRNPPSPVPVVSWFCYLVFSLLLSVAWWEKILLFIVLFFAPMFIRGFFIEGRRKWLQKKKDDQHDTDV